MKQGTTNITGPRKLSECFASQENAKAVAILFSYHIAKILPNSILGTLDMSGHFQQKR